MTLFQKSMQPVWPALAWSSAALLGLVVPAAAIVVLARPDETSASELAQPAILALALMSAGMIASAATGRFWAGVGVSLGAALALLLFSSAIGRTTTSEPLSLGVAALIASLSFAARGTLFARSAEGRGWWVAIAVIAGEAAVVISAVIDPGVWPNWLLVLLPAQWATMAIDSAFADVLFVPALTALGGTAVATLLVAHLWPRRWTYGIMFSVWLGLSAFVYHSSY